MIESLTREARAELRTRYRDDKLFRAWSHPLLELQREMGQPAPEEIWYLTERLHVRLRDLGDGAPYEIEYVFREIYESLISDDMTKGGQYLYGCRGIDRTAQSVECLQSEGQGGGCPKSRYRLKFVVL